jgi:hypothetical protein
MAAPTAEDMAGRALVLGEPEAERQSNGLGPPLHQVDNGGLISHAERLEGLFPAATDLQQ